MTPMVGFQMGGGSVMIHFVVMRTPQKGRGNQQRRKGRQGPVGGDSGAGHGFIVINGLGRVNPVAGSYIPLHGKF
jgi:hypothetical protein